MHKDAGGVYRYLLTPDHVSVLPDFVSGGVYRYLLTPDHVSVLPDFVCVRQALVG
jgi:hypothetical protein